MDIFGDEQRDNIDEFFNFIDKMFEKTMKVQHNINLNNVLEDLDIEQINIED